MLGLFYKCDKHALQALSVSTDVLGVGIQSLISIAHLVRIKLIGWRLTLRPRVTALCIVHGIMNAVSCAISYRDTASQ